VHLRRSKSAGRAHTNVPLATIHGGGDLAGPGLDSLRSNRAKDSRFVQRCGLLPSTAAARGAPIELPAARLILIAHPHVESAMQNSGRNIDAVIVSHARPFEEPENASRDWRSLVDAKSSPCTWTYADEPGEHSRQVALIGEATLESDFI